MSEFNKINIIKIIKIQIKYIFFRLNIAEIDRGFNGLCYPQSVMIAGVTVNLRIESKLVW